MVYDTATGEIIYNTGKTFVIDHPSNKENKYLVHACLEGPEVGVYYRGKISEEEKSVDIFLPDYIKDFVTDMTVQLTSIYGGADNIKTTEVDEIEGKFTVYGTPGRFNWIVLGKRGILQVEVDKNSVNVKGDGPYRWI